MDKIATPVLLVALALGGFYLVNTQFKNVQQAVQQQPQLPPFKANPIQIQPFQPIKPFNPFAPEAEPPEPAEADFTPAPFETPNGFYKAVFPGGKPRKATMPHQVHCYRITKEVAVFEVNYYEYRGGDGISPGAWLKYVHARQLEGMHAREESRREVRFDDVVPGIEFEALFPKGDKAQRWIGKTFLVGSDVVTASVYGDPNVVEQRGYTFLKSFLITQKAIDDAKLK